MTPTKLLVIISFAVIVVKLITSFTGRGNLPILNQLVTVILSIFVFFELFQLGQALWIKFT